MMLDARLDRGEVTPEMIAELGRIVADFHQHAQTSGTIALAGDLEGIRFNVEENFEQTVAYIGRTNLAGHLRCDLSLRPAIHDGASGALPFPLGERLCP